MVVSESCVAPPARTGKVIEASAAAQRNVIYLFNLGHARAHPARKERKGLVVGVCSSSDLMLSRVVSMIKQGFPSYFRVHNMIMPDWRTTYVPFCSRRYQMK